MTNRFEASVARRCIRWAAAVEQRPVRTLVITGIATLAAAVYAAFGLGVNADPKTLIDSRLPFQVRQRELVDTFRTLNDGILVVIEADTAVRAARAADALAARLTSRTDLFSQVDVPGGGPFFARNALLYLEPDQLDDLVNRLSQVQPFLAELAKDQSLVGIATLLRDALVEQRKGTPVGLDLAMALDRVSGAIEATTDRRAAADPWGTALLGGAMPDEARLRVVALRPQLDYSSLLNAAPHVQAIRDAAAALGLTPDRGVRVRITGDPVLNYEELLAIGRQFHIIAVVSFVLFTAVVFVALRSLRVVLALVASLLAGLLWSNAFAALAVGSLNQISACFNVLIIGLGGELQIHMCMRYLELIAAGRSRRQAILETAESMGPSLFSSACTTAIGFYIFLLTDFTGVAQLGLIAGTGMFLSLLSGLTVLPAVLAFGPPPIPAPTTAPPSVTWLSRLPLRYAGPIRLATGVVMVGAVALLPRVHFNYNLLDLRDPSTESVQTFEDLLARSGTTPWTIDVIAPDVSAAKALATQLSALEVVEHTRTIEEVVPGDQDEKLEMLQMAGFFVPAEIGTADRRPGPVAERAALERLEREAGAAGGSGDGVGRAAHRLQQALERFLATLNAEPSPAAALARLQANVVGSLPEQLRELRPLLSATRVGVRDLPVELSGQMVAADGRARIEVYPRSDLSDSVALEQFVDTVRQIAPGASGGAVWMVEWGRVTWHAMALALSIGMVCMIAFLILLWRNVWDTVLAFVPLALAVLVTGAAMALLGAPFNFANVIVLPMLVGMGVDNGVHLVHRHRTRPDEIEVLASSTARAVVVSAVTTIMTFGSMAFASHRGIAAIGQLLTLGVFLTLVSYVVVLPAILEWDDRRRRRRALVAAPRG
jgi:hypothetical protein